MSGLNQFCPRDGLCNWVFLYKTLYKNYNLPIYQCQTCGFQAQFPQPTELESLYTQDYYSGSADYAYIDERRLEKFHSYVWDSRLSIIQREINKIKKIPDSITIGTVYDNTSILETRSDSISETVSETGKESKNSRIETPKQSQHLLEVGSSFGGFLRCARERGWAIQGIEFSEYSGRFAIEQGIPTHIGSLETYPCQEPTFDCIVLNEVIEHLPDPPIALDILTRLLKPGGLLVIQTANFEGWQAKEEGPGYHYYLPGHLFYYSEAVLRKSLEIRGFSHFRVFYGSDVTLMSKLRKMRGGFTRSIDYLRWFRTGIYHFKSKLKKQGYPLTSGFVLYAFKEGRACDSVE